MQVDIGSLQVDYSSLVWERKVALKNMPRGHTRIVLSGKDLGNFVTHPIFKQVAATAVQVSKGRHLNRHPQTLGLWRAQQGHCIRFKLGVCMFGSYCQRWELQAQLSSCRA